MAEYGRLRFGGGLRFRSTGTAERTGDGALCIGIGGTGTDAVRQLKQMVYEQLKPDKMTPDGPQYETIRFLAADSDPTGFQISGMPEDICREEWVDLRIDKFRGMTGHMLCQLSEDMKWVNPDLRIPNRLLGGACAVRQIGRLQVILQSDVLYREMKKQILAMIHAGAKQINVHVFAGLCGGTGGGGVVDLCYLIRHLSGELGAGIPLRINGYFFMPDVYRERFGMHLGPEMEKRMKMNGYAALRELDYLMGMKGTKDRFCQSYGLIQVRTDQAPVDFCWLISSAFDQDGQTYPHTVHVAADCAFHSLLRGAAAAPDGFSFLTDLVPMAKEKKTHGGFCGYLIPGVANVGPPISDVCVYLATRLLGSFCRQDRCQPGMEWAERLQKRMGIYEGAIRQRLTQGMERLPLQLNYSTKDLKADSMRPMADGDRWLGEMKRILDGNLNALRKNIGGCLYGQGFSEEERERIFGWEMPPDGGECLKRRIEEMLARVRSRIFQEVQSSQWAKIRLNQALDQMKAAGWGIFGTARKEREEYIRCAEEWFGHISEYEIARRQEIVVQELAEETERFQEKFAKPFWSVLNDLQNVFEENEKALQERLPLWTRNTWKLPELEKLLSKLDQALASIDVTMAEKSFLSCMAEKYPTWSKDPEREIPVLIQKFVKELFPAIGEMTMEDYIKIGFPRKDSSQRIRMVQDPVIRGPLRSRAQPLMGMGDWVRGMPSECEAEAVFVPANMPELVTAAEEYEKTSAACVREIQGGEHISMMRLASGVPLYAYRMVPQAEKMEAERVPEPGTYLYESKEMDWRERLPRLVPKSEEIP